MAQKNSGGKPQVPQRPTNPNKPQTHREGGKINEGVGPKSPK